jgi:hypothetical protein
MLLLVHRRGNFLVTGSMQVSGGCCSWLHQFKALRAALQSMRDIIDIESPVAARKSMFLHNPELSLPFSKAQLLFENHCLFDLGVGEVRTDESIVPTQQLSRLVFKRYQFTQNNTGCTNQSTPTRDLALKGEI